MPTLVQEAIVDAASNAATARISGMKLDDIVLEAVIRGVELGRAAYAPEGEELDPKRVHALHCTIGELHLAELATLGLWLAEKRVELDDELISEAHEGLPLAVTRVLALETTRELMEGVV